jgi:hypothetical protein
VCEGRGRERGGARRSKGRRGRRQAGTTMVCCSRQQLGCVAAVDTEGVYPRYRCANE